MRTFEQNHKAIQQVLPAKSNLRDGVSFGQTPGVNAFPHSQCGRRKQTVQRLLQSDADNLLVESSNVPSSRFSHDFSHIPVQANTSARIQPKLQVSSPGGKYEQEADRVADQVIRISEPHVRNQEGAMIKQEGRLHAKSSIQRMATFGSVASAPPSVHEVLNRPGRPLDASTRAFMEPRFGADFGEVRIHDDSEANTAARDVGALAFTVGNAIVFRSGSYRLNDTAGRKLLAHELTHVMQQSQSSPHGGVHSVQRVSTGTTLLQRMRCKGDEDPETIIASHTVNPTTIKKPGDSVDIDARFNCEVRSWDSIIEKADGTSLGLKMPMTQITDRFTRTWDGKKLFKGIGTFLVDDGDYRHRFDNLKFGYKYNPKTKLSEDVFAIGPNLVSPIITVSSRAYHGPGVPHHHANLQNENSLADIIKSEMGVGNDTEKKAVAWAVRNQMVRLSTSSVDIARDYFKDAHNQAAGLGEKAIATVLLQQSLSHDITGGSIKWFSPKSMPKKGESCSKYDCGGGLITVNDNAGKARQVYAPSWHKTMRFIPVVGTREWIVRFYAL